MMLVSRKSLAALATMGALILTGCAAPAPQGQQPDQGQEQNGQAQTGQEQTGAQENSATPEAGETAPDGSETSTTEEEQPTEDGTDAEGNAAPDAKVFASKKISVEESKLKVDLYEIKDDGALATVNLGLTVEDGERFQISNVFADGSINEPGKGGTRSVAWQYSMSGVTLTDTKNKKIHRVAYDTGMDCLCSSSLHRIYLQPGDTVYLNASFASIPDGQDSATVTIPNVGTFTNVPINR